MSLRPFPYACRAQGTRIALKAAEIEKWGCGVASPPASGAALGGEPAGLAGTARREKGEATPPTAPLFIDSRPEDKEALKPKVRPPLDRGGEVLFRKQRFGVFSNPNVDTVLEAVRPDRIVVYGVALDVCDRYAVDGLLDRRRYRVALVQDATRAIDPGEGDRLVQDWAARGVCLVTTDQVIGGVLGI